jgi:hypothetical protein
MNLIQEESINNPTLIKMNLIKSYQNKSLELKDVVDKIYEIDNPPLPKYLKILLTIFLILLGPVLSSTQRDINRY